MIVNNEESRKELQKWYNDMCEWINENKDEKVPDRFYEVRLALKEWNEKNGNK